MVKKEGVRLGEFVSHEKAKLINEGKLKCLDPNVKIVAVEFRGGLYKVQEAKTKKGK